jgi:hypothetical protein
MGAAATASAQSFYSVVQPGPFASMSVTLGNTENDITATVTPLGGSPILNMDLTPQGYVNINGRGLNDNSGEELNVQFSSVITSFQINWAAYDSLAVYDEGTPNILDLSASLYGNLVGTATSSSLFTGDDTTGCSGYDEGTAIYSDAGGFDGLVISFDPSSQQELLVMGSDVAGTGTFGDQTVVTPAPEPASLALAGMGGLATLLAFRRRK